MMKMVTACFMDRNNTTAGMVLFAVDRETAMIVRHAHEGGRYEKVWISFDNKWEEIEIPEDWDSHAVDYVSRYIIDMYRDGNLQDSPNLW